MSRKNLDELNLENIFDLMSRNFEVTYDELLNVLRDESNYKRLLRIGEKQYFDAPTESSIEAESQKSRLCFAKINLLAVEVDNDIDRIIEDKMQGDFLIKLKEEVLKAVSQLSTKQKSSTELFVSPSKSPAKQKRNDDKVVLEKIKDLSQYCAQNLNDIRKQVSEMPIEGAELDAVDKKKEIEPNITVKETADIDNSDTDFGNISFGSVSSVHTSELSSFDDDVILSSDEESGLRGKKLSLKAVQEKLDHLKAARLESAKDDQQDKNAHPVDIVKSETSLNGSHNVSQKPQRARKPNLKYLSDDVTSTLKRKSMEEIPSDDIPTPSPSPSVDSNVPRKRGRPRKYLT